MNKGKPTTLFDKVFLELEKKKNNNWSFLMQVDLNNYAKMTILIRHFSEKDKKILKELGIYEKNLSRKIIGREMHNQECEITFYDDVLEEVGGQQWVGYTVFTKKD